MADLSPAEQLVADLENLTEKVKQEQDRSDAASQRGDDETLSISLNSLARINSSLGRKAAYAKYIARNASRAVERLKEEKDAERSRLTLEYSKTQAVGKSEHQAKVSILSWVPKIDEAYSTYSEAKLIADQADDLAFRTDTFLKLAQSRLSLLKQDKRR